MRFSSLGSGSKGNATLIEWRGTCIMLDCGFSIKDTIRRLQRLGKTPEDISAIVATHEHSDHWKGVLPLATRYSIDVYATAGCLRATGVSSTTYKGLKLIDSHSDLMIGDIRVNPVPVPHDAREPVQFVFSSADHRLGVLTDIGSITPYVEALYRDCDGLVVEANHDLNLLASGTYPSFLKDRVAGQWGHLNNSQTAALISSIDQQRIQHLVVAHISQNNNSLDLVKAEIEAVYQGSGRLYYACQDQGFDWLELV
ncbi:MAG: MBL fold metallo-hydrolase [Porticoccaceae bacterium]|nr:MBL fold metallo-hydrolase [Porticoccaceae bacterium]